jgi:hypothetical protein
MSTRFRRFIRLPHLMLWAFLMETVETKQMLHTFLRHGRGKLLVSGKGRKPTPEELRLAMEQLKDIPRILPFFVFVVAPIPGVTEGYVLMAFTLEKWLGQRIRVLPTQFRGVFEKYKAEIKAYKQQNAAQKQEETNKE